MINASLNDAGMDVEDELEESGSDYGYIEKSERKVFIERDQFSILKTKKKKKRGDIILKPVYQREIVWTPKKQSRLIESVMLNIPIPVIYLAELEDGKREVVDGQQRLHTFITFMDNTFSLSGLTILDDLNSRTFNQLEEDFPELQRKLEDYQLSFFIIKKESHEDIRFDIFQRVNEGATPLNAQELRNSIYRGPRIDLLKRMAENEHFKKLTENRLAFNRLKNHEAVLRFLAFYLNGYESYRGNLNTFLNNTLENLDMDAEKVKKLENLFSKTMENIYDVLGKDAFVKGDSTKKKVNLSIFDILSYSFAIFAEHKLFQMYMKKIKPAFDELYRVDSEFGNSITSNTLTRNNVRTRFEKWLTVMVECLGYVE